MAQQMLLPGDRIFHALPISHSFGLISALLCGLRAGATFQFATRFSAEKLAHALLHDGVRCFRASPPCTRGWPSGQRRPVRADAQSLRMAYIGGSQIDRDPKGADRGIAGSAPAPRLRLTESAPGRRPAPSAIRHRRKSPPAGRFPASRSCLRDETGRATGSRRPRRGLHPRTERDEGVLPRSPANPTGDRCAGLAAYRRYRPLRTARRPVDRRAHQGHDHPRRLQRLSGGGGGRDRRVSRCRPVRGARAAGRRR